MKRTVLAALAALSVSACAEGYYGPYGGGGTAYYDGFYGPYDSGYWGRDNFFYYRNGHGRPYYRDDGRHFRRGPAPGYRGVHGHPGFHGWPHGRPYGGRNPGALHPRPR